jgi:hypothetical protein
MKPFSSPSGCQVQPRPLPIVAKKKTLTPLRKRHLENGAESPSTSDIASTRPRRTSMLMDHGSASPGPKRSARKSNSTKDYVAHRLKQTDSPSAKRKLGRQEDEADKEDDEDDDLVERL